MILLDVNVLIYAHRAESEHHEAVAQWLVEAAAADRPLLLADVVVAGFLRIATHPRILSPPTPPDRALAFIDGLQRGPTTLSLAAGPRHWEIFRRLVVEADARGNLIPDAHLSAIAVEHGATIATRDRGFSRFPGVSWFDPIAAG